jgi:hypothetical protein
VYQKAQNPVYAIYYPDTDYPNIRTCYETSGNGVWVPPISNRIRPPFYEIGVLEILEIRNVYRVEVSGSGCSTPVKLTCNGITINVYFFHDYDRYDRYGSQIIVFDIEPSANVTIYTSVHDMNRMAGALLYDHGFRIEWIKVYYMR